MNISPINSNVNFGRVTPIIVEKDKKAVPSNETILANFFWNSKQNSPALEFIAQSRLNEEEIFTGGGLKGRVKPDLRFIDGKPYLVTGNDTKKSNKDLKPDDEEKSYLKLSAKKDDNNPIEVTSIYCFLDDKDSHGNLIMAQESLNLNA